MLDNSNRLIFISILLVVLLSLGSSYAEERLNPHTLCPANGSKGQTILLIDTTDPLTLKDQEKLKQVFNGFQDPDNEYYLQPAYELIIYYLTSQIEDLQEPLRFCNPGNPKDRNWKDNLATGKYGDLRRWRLFQQKIKHALPSINEQIKGTQSPLLESIARITARHVHSLGVGKERKPTRLFIFSDLLQNSNKLSHYRLLPDTAIFRDLPGYAEMESDLKGVDVWLFYIRRTGMESRQTSKHYYWWTRVIEFFDGRLMKQIPL